MNSLSRTAKSTLVGLLAILLVTLGLPFSAARADVTTTVTVTLAGVDELSGDSTAVSTTDGLDLIVLSDDVQQQSIHGTDVSEANSAAAGTVFEFSSVLADANFDYVAMLTSGINEDHYVALGHDVSWQSDGDGNIQFYSNGLAKRWTGLSETPAAETLTLKTLASGNGDIHGTVYDSSNQVADGAVVTLTEEFKTPSGIKLTRHSSATADGAGEYTAGGIRVGASVWVSASWDNGDNWDSEQLTVSSAFSSRRLNLYATPVASSGGSASYNFVLRDSDGNDLTGGIYVGIYGESWSNSCDQSDANFSCDSLAPGDYVLEISADGFVSRNVSFSVADGDTSIDGGVITLEFAPSGTSSFSGVVTVENLSDYSLVQGLMVHAYPVAINGVDEANYEFIPSYATVDPNDGSWSITGLPAGQYRLQLTHDGAMDSDAAVSASPESQTFTVAADQGQVVNFAPLTYFEPTAGASLTLVAKDSNTRLPVEGLTCVLRITSQVGNLYAYPTATTDSLGHVVFENVIAGESYTAYCEARDLTYVSKGNKSVTIAAGANSAFVSVNVVRFDPASVIGKIVDSNGNPVEGIRVIAGWEAAPNAGNDTYQDLSNEDGTFLVPGFATGRKVTIDIQDPTHQYADMSLSFDANQVETDLGEIIVNPGVTVIGDVSVSGSPSGISVQLSSTSSPTMYGGSVRSNGTFAMDKSVAIGSYQVFVSSDKFAKGWVSADGSLVSNRTEAQIFDVTDSSPTFRLPTIYPQLGSELTASFTFTDQDGSQINNASLEGTAKLWALVDGTWQEVTSSAQIFQNNRLNNELTFSNLPAGTYRVCFTDDAYRTNLGRFAETCSSSTGVSLLENDSASIANVALQFAAPAEAPGLVTMDADLLAILQDQISVVSRGSDSTQVQVESDLAGQWVAAEITAGEIPLAPSAFVGPASILHPATVAVPQLSAWLAVDANGQVDVPKSLFVAGKTNKLILLNSQNLPIGWTSEDVAAASPEKPSSSNQNDVAASSETETSVTDSLEPVATATPEANSLTPVEKAAPVSELNLSIDWVWWLVGIGAGGLVVALTLIRRSRSRF